tara:strand:- start:257 stop:1801 length:1545 start_codon:yes stop_codon:yes gene_type:complete
MSVNPDTGLPEYFLGDVFDTVKASVKNYFKPENLIPAIASIALPAIAGPAFAGFTNLSPLATRSILSGAGTALGSLPFRSFEDSLSAGIVSGGLQYGTGRLRQALGPTDADLGIDDDSAKALLKDQRAIAGNKLEQYYRQKQLEALEAAPTEELIDFPLDDPSVSIADAYSPMPTVDYNLPIDQIMQNLPAGERIPILSATQVEQQFPKTFEDLQKSGVIDKDDISFIEKTGTVSPEQQARVMALQRMSPIAKPPNAISRRALPSIGADQAFISESALKGKEFPDRFSAAREAFSKDGLQAGFEAIPQGYMTPDGDVDTDAIFGDIGRGLASVEATSLVDAVEAQRMAEEEAAQQLIERGVPPKIARKRVTIRRRTGEFGGTGAGLTAAEARRRAIEGGGFEFFGPTQFVPAAQGGLVGLAAGGRPDFEGIVGGDGHGMEDNQIMEIKGGGLLAVSPKEYVVPADVMAMIGNGNPDDGADEMDEFISKFRKEKYGRDMQPPEMDGGKALQSLMS